MVCPLADGHVRFVLEYNEGNPGLRESSVELCSREGLLGVYQKSHSVSHRLRMRILMSI